MIQIGSFVNIIDNSGGKKAYCIRVIGGYKKRYALLGDTILVAIYALRKKRKALSKVKKGEMYKALIVRTKSSVSHFSADTSFFLENSVILFNKQNKVLGTRIFGSITKSFRSTKYMRLISMSSGVIA
jgi:large subunit ribosomal protein L14